MHRIVLPDAFITDVEEFIEQTVARSHRDKWRRLLIRKPTAARTKIEELPGNCKKNTVSDHEWDKDAFDKLDVDLTARSWVWDLEEDPVSFDSGIPMSIGRFYLARLHGGGIAVGITDHNSEIWLMIGRR